MIGDSWKNRMLSSVNHQAQENSFTWAQADRKDRLTANLDKLAEMKKAQNEQAPQN